MQAVNELRGSWRWLTPILCLVFGTVIGVAGYYAGIPFETRMWMRAGLCIIFIAVLLITKRNTPAWDTVLALLAVSAGLLAAGLIGDRVTDWFNLSGENARVYAIDKIGETLPIIFIILLLVILSGRDLKGMYLWGGRVGMSLLGGLAVSILLFIYFLAQGGWQIFQPSVLQSLISDIAWIAIFSLFNGFMEELWFRGLFLSRFEALLGKRSAFWITAVLFGLLHVFGSFTGTIGSLLLVGFTLLMGMAFGWIVQRTGSIWGAVLGHFFADFFLLLGYFSTLN